jgi:uroporphyrinogen decarboxylase
MTSRERVLAALRHESTDRVPRLLYGEAIGYVPAIDRLLREKCAPKSPCEYFQMDIAGLNPNPTRLSPARFRPWLGVSADDALTAGEVDEWGVWWRKGNFHHFAHIESTLRDIATVDDLHNYPWPDLDQPYRFEGFKARVDALHVQGLAVASFAGSIFEQAWYMRGMDQFLMDMMADPEMASFLLDRTADMQRKVAVELARAGVDIIITGDDVAMQNGLILKIDTWRSFLKPRLAATIQAAKEARSDVAILYHSDGNVEPLIPELIEVGIDILNPVQPECMAPAAIKAKYGGQVALWGAVSVQQTMPFGTPAEVKAEVRERIRTLGKGGGYILAPAHVLGPEVPWENIVAFFEAADTTPL